ncbi:2-oxo acid dehydrogenase subunit E2 [Streptosporangium sp. NPDC087985]|uniref:2-oxo acid dehydrogenase subunit E2 n=1 Tax=Streptosporangium sp. NPDC087985 TaxID=3366196 RepID=UPI00382A4245
MFVPANMPAAAAIVPKIPSTAGQATLLATAGTSLGQPALARVEFRLISARHGGTFTITNPGPFGTLISAPIINQPQVAILSTDGIRKRR